MEQAAKDKGLVSKSDFTKMTTELAKANDIITETQTYLGVNDLADLPSLNGKTLNQLLDDSSQLRQFKYTIKNDFNITNLTEWDKHLVKKEDLDNINEQMKNYQTNLISLGITNLDG